MLPAKASTAVNVLSRWILCECYTDERTKSFIAGNQEEIFAYLLYVCVLLHINSQSTLTFEQIKRARERTT